MPGVLLIEGMAQTAGVLCLRQMARLGGEKVPSTSYFLTIDKAKFRKPAVPGDTIDYHVDKLARTEQHVVVPRRSQSRRCADCRSRSRRHHYRGLMAIDPTARVAAAAGIGNSVEIGPYCLVGPQVELARGVRLLAHVNVTGATTIGERSVIYPFSSLGTPPQSVHYRGGATRTRDRRRVRIARERDHEYRHRNGGGITRVGDRCSFMVGCHVGHDCAGRQRRHVRQ